jgi:hypothetical protein
MAGCLFHGRGFRKEYYVSDDNLEHYEVLPIDGDIDHISVSNIDELQNFCATKTISQSSWPYYRDSIDLPMEEVVEKNKVLHDLLVNLPMDDVNSQYWLEKLVSYIKRGEIFFLTD